MAVIEKIHIVATAGILGGKPRVDGTRIAVEHIAIAYNDGQNIDEIVASYQGITYADVFAALAYYYDHKSEMDTKIVKDEKEFEKLYDSNIKKTANLRNKLKQRGEKMGIRRAD